MGEGGKRMCASRSGGQEGGKNVSPGEVVGGGRARIEKYGRRDWGSGRRCSMLWGCPMGVKVGGRDEEDESSGMGDDIIGSGMGGRDGRGVQNPLRRRMGKVTHPLWGWTAEQKRGIARHVALMCFLCFFMGRRGGGSVYKRWGERPVFVYVEAPCRMLRIESKFLLHALKLNDQNCSASNQRSLCC